MKKGIVILLSLLLLLTGCQETQMPTEPTTQTTAAPTEPGRFVSGSDVQVASKGALRQFDISDKDCFCVAVMGDGLLLFSGDEKTELELISRDEGKTLAKLLLPVDLRSSSWATLNNGFGYYDAEENQAVILDTQLRERQTLRLPEQLQGAPLFSPDGGEIFYCAGQEIRALDTDRGISRLIKSHPCKSQNLIGVYFDGTLLCCETINEADAQSFMYVSAENGATVYSGQCMQWLDTQAEKFITSRMDGVVQQCIFGSREGQLQQLNVKGDRLIPAAAMDEVVSLAFADDGKCILSLYALSPGVKQSDVELPAVADTVDVYPDVFQKAYWVLTDGKNGQSLLLWTPERETKDETIVAGPLYTSDAPDTQGLEQLQKRVDSINKTHGVMIRIWQTALKTTGGYTFVPEHQVDAISSILDRIEPILSAFPERFLSKSAPGKIRICIVRSLEQEEDALLFWDDGDPFIVLSVRADIEDALLKGIAEVVDSHTLGNSPYLDDWNDLNPEDFTYGDDAPGKVDYLAYLEPDARCFTDAEAMRSVSSDRAGIFRQAMLADNEEMFSTETMQAKLLLLCRSIRDAWRLEFKTETYPWEQYLHESIAYVK